jgi:hypothetical protein
MDPDSSLPPVWIVGFTGHRRLREPEKVGALLRQLLHSLGSEIPGQLVGHSSVAIGGDTLFAEACSSSGIPWIALLPLAEGDFKCDFTEADWNKARQLLQTALRVESLVGAKDRNVAYLECGLATVEEADLMIAIWDGEPSRGTGGTAEVVTHARNFGKPLILIHPDSLTTHRERFAPDYFSDPEMEYLNRLPNRAEVANPPSTQIDERVRRFFSKVDAEAARIAPRFRRWVAASVIMNAIAAILTAAAVGFGFHSTILDGAIFVLIAAAMLSIIQIKRKHAHQNWIRCRVAAEICRSALVTWNMSDVAAPVWFTQLGDFRRLAKSIRLLQMRPGEQTRNMGFAEIRSYYLTNRVDDQIEYFRRRSRRLATALLIFTCSFWIFSAAAVARTIFTAIVTVPRSDNFIIATLQSFLPIALPLAAGCVLSLVSIFDLNRQLASSKAMQATLQTARKQIEKCESFSSLRRAVENTENAFAGEFFEWFTLFRFPRFN